MRLTLTLLGMELDLSFGPASPEADEPDPLRDLGYTSATPAGFTANHDVPDEVPLPMRNNGWGDEGNRA